MTHLRGELVAAGKWMQRDARQEVDRKGKIIRLGEDRFRTDPTETRMLFTIPYTGTWGVVIGKATGAGAWGGHERIQSYSHVASVCPVRSTFLLSRSYPVPRTKV